MTGAVFLTAVLCLAQALTMLGVFAFPALLPTLLSQTATANPLCLAEGVYT